MASQIKVSFDLSKLQVFLTSLNEKAVKQAVRKSIQKTFSGIKVDVVKEINKGKFYDKKRLPTAKVKDKYFRETKNLSSTAELTDMYAAFEVSSKKLDLIVFFAKRIQTAITKVNSKPMYGVSVSTLGNRRTPKGAFIGNIGKPNEQIFKRKDKSRLPIRKMQGPSLSTLFEHTHAATRIQNEANDRLSREMETNLAYYLSKL